jgi:hypothetical protein
LRFSADIRDTWSRLRRAWPPPVFRISTRTPLATGSSRQMVRRDRQEFLSLQTI